MPRHRPWRVGEHGTSSTYVVDDGTAATHMVGRRPRHCWAARRAGWAADQAGSRNVLRFNKPGVRWDGLEASPSAVTLRWDGPPLDALEQSG